MASLARISEKLDLKEFQLRSLLDITKAISTNKPVDEILGLFKEVVHTELGITRLVLYSRTDGWKQLLSLGTHYGEELALLSALSDLTDIQMIGNTEANGAQAFDVAIPVLNEDEPIALLLIGDIEETQGMSPTVKHLNFIQTLTNVVVVALENRRLLIQALEQERNERELELAADIQGKLFPEVLPNHAGLEMASWYKPHREIGGDHYDVIELPNGDVVFCIADVSGKGIPASLLMSNFQATLSALVPYVHEDLEELVVMLNQKVYHSAKGERFITMFIGKYNSSTRTLSYVSAGHNPSLLMTGNYIVGLSEGTVGLGMLEELPFLKHGEVQVPKGSVLLCYTDGLSEQENQNGEQFEMERIAACMKACSKKGMKDLTKHLESTLDSFKGDTAPLDDIAVLACRFK
jgi:sigma-B regulation protein RsbU (phosphoserine phosphatase)